MPVCLCACVPVRMRPSHQLNVCFRALQFLVWAKDRVLHVGLCVHRISADVVVTALEAVFDPLLNGKEGEEADDEENDADASAT